MIIDSSTISMFGRHELDVEHVRRESARAWVGNGSSEGNKKVSLDGVDLSNFDKTISKIAGNLEKSADVEDFLSGAKLQLSPAAKAAPSAAAGAADTEEDMELEMLKRLFEKITGKKMTIFNLQKEIDKVDKANQALCEALGQATAPQGQQSQQPVGWGLQAEVYERYSESEKMSFQASGLVRTADGKEIAFGLNVSMSRSFVSEQYASVALGDAALMKDPLVINFGGPSTSLTKEKYSFDIDADGEADKVSFVSQGSGLLALDKNGDGQINDGNELFGAKSGDGFKDLSSYDDDGNGWIDERDTAFQKLKIWSKDAGGNDQLLGLAEVGVGAIYLDKVSTDYSFRDQDDQSVQGEMRSSGVFLMENGQAGAMHQVDLAVGE